MVELDLSNNVIPKEGAAALAKVITKCNALQTLNLGGNNLSDEGIQILSSVLPQCNLQHLDLHCNNFGAKGMEELAKVLHITNIISINIAYNDIGPKGAYALAHILNLRANIENINLIYNNIGPEGAEFLASSLKKATDLEGIYIRDSDIGDKGAEALAKILPCFNNLRSLVLSSNKIGIIGINFIANMLPKCFNLYHINLGYNDIKNNGAKALSKVIPYCFNLQKIELAHSKISTQGIKALVNAFPECPNLLSINLRYNYISNNAIKYLIDNLSRCVNLSQLDFTGINIGEKCQNAILHFLQKSKYITTCLIFNKGNFQEKINTICKVNKEYFKEKLEVHKLDQILQDDGLYEKLYACPALLKALEDGYIKIESIHTKLQNKSLNEINILEIRNQCISEFLYEHYYNKDLPPEKFLFHLENLIDKSFYGYDPIPQIIEYKHFSFAKDLMHILKASNYVGYLHALINVIIEPTSEEKGEYDELANIIIANINDLSTNLSYMQAAVNMRNIALIQLLKYYHAYEEKIIVEEKGYIEDVMISHLFPTNKDLDIDLGEQNIVEAIGNISLQQGV